MDIHPQVETGKLPILWVPGQTYSFQQSHHALRFLYGAGRRIITLSNNSEDVKVFRSVVSPDRDAHRDSLLALIEHLKLEQVNVVDRLESTEDVFRAVLQRPYRFKNVVIVMPPAGHLDPEKSSEIVDQGISISLIYEPNSAAVFRDSRIITLVLAAIE